MMLLASPSSRESNVTFYARYGKRWLDVVLAGTALILFAPIFVIVAILVRLKLGSPVIFRQARPGKDEQPFEMVKFRTMTDARDADGNLLPDDQRLTRFGKFLRSTSLDELPELWNILKGEMSVVGPRPLLISYLPFYNEEERRRHHVLPGLTGWAQIHGRINLAWDDKLRLDVWYVDHCGLWLDLKVIVLTFWKVVRREDVHAADNVYLPSLDEERMGRA